jgi:hypothetical protein
MPEWGEVMEANRLAQERQQALAVYAGQVENEAREGDITLAVALAADALIHRIAASTMQLGYHLQKVGA